MSVLQGVRDAVMWLAVHHKDKKALEFFAKEIAPAGTGMGKFQVITNQLINFILLFILLLNNTGPP